MRKHLTRLPSIAPVSSAVSMSSVVPRSSQVMIPSSTHPGVQKQPNLAAPVSSSSSSLSFKQPSGQQQEKPKAKQPTTQPIAPSSSSTMTAAQRLKANLALARKRARG